MTARPPFPLDLSIIAPPGDLVLLHPTALGVAVRLLRQAWDATRPCSLPDDPAALARLSGLTLDEWRGIAPAIEGLTARQEAVVVFPRALSAYRESARRREGRIRASAAANAARWGPAASDSDSESDPRRIPPSHSPLF